MKEIIKIERFLEVLKDAWENQKPQIEMEGFSRYVEFTMFVSPDFGNYPDLIDFEAELLTVDEKLIKDKIKNINSICDKMRKDYDFVMQNRKIEKFYPIGSNNEKLSSTIHTAVHGLAPTCSGDVTIKLHFDDNDLINTIEKIKTIINQPKRECDKTFITPLSQVRMKAIYKYLSAEKYISVDEESCFIGGFKRGWNYTKRVSLIR
jgi:hypothetical protein